MHRGEMNSLSALGKPEEKVAESKGETATKLEIQIIQVLSLPYLLLLFSVFLYLLVSTKFNPLRIEPGLIGCYHQFGFLKIQGIKNQATTIQLRIMSTPLPTTSFSDMLCKLTSQICTSFNLVLSTL